MKKLLAVVLMATVGAASPVCVAAEPGASAAEMAEKLANPTAAVASMTSNFDFTEYEGNLPGADDQRGWSYVFQPSLPFPQASGKNILFRPAIPVLVKQPVFDGGEWKDEFELGDIGFDLAYGGTNPKTGLLLLGGLVGSIPTATSDAVGSDQWIFGPEAMVGIAKKWGVLGLLVSHKQDVFGDNKKATKITGGQYFYAFPFGDGSWQVASGPAWSYNHELSGEKWTLPLGIGLNKVAMIGDRVWKFSVQYWNYIKTPDAFGPEHTIRFTITPVMSVPWGRAAAVATAAQIDSGEWTPITSAMEVRAIYTNSVAIGDTWAGEYCADGTGTLTAYGETFKRQWEIKGAQACVTSDQGTFCATFERSTKNPNEYRLTNLSSGRKTKFILVDRSPLTCDK
jgi:hypothetical protein